MTEIINFIIVNYTWILAIVILILLAIIGGIADRTNFGEGKSNIEEKKQETPNIDLSNKRMDDFFSNEKKSDDNNADVNKETNNNNFSSQNQTIANNNISQSSNAMSNVQNEPTSSNKDIMKSLEDKLSSLDSEINSALPKKSIINNDMLEDIDDMSFEGKDLFNDTFDNDFGTDDLDLPRIKSPKKENEDVWKL